MRAIFLIAGTGSRLKPLTNKIHKCLTEVNNVKIFDNALQALKAKSINEVVLVTGYLHESIREHVDKYWKDEFRFSFVYNKDYETTNNIYSLWLASEYLREPFLLIEGDVHFDKNILMNTTFGEKSLWFGDEFAQGMDGCRLQTNTNKKISKIEIIRDPEAISSNTHFKSVGMMYFADNATLMVDKLTEEVKRDNVNIYYDLFFAKYIDLFDIYINDVAGEKWFEIDTIEDLQQAETLF